MLKDRKKYWAVLLASLWQVATKHRKQLKTKVQLKRQRRAVRRQIPRAATRKTHRQSPLEIGDRLGKLSKSYIEIMESGNYYMAFRSTTTFEGEMMESETMMTVSGDRTAMQSKSADTETGW